MGKVSHYATFDKEDMRILTGEFQPSVLWPVSELITNRLILSNFHIAGDGDDKNYVRSIRQNLLDRYDALITFREKTFSSKRHESSELLALLAKLDAELTEDLTGDTIQGKVIGAGLAAATSDQAVLMAAKKDRFAFDLALRICDIRLSIQMDKTENSLSNEMIDFLRGVISGRIKRPAKKGPHPAATHQRDGAICGLVRICELNGLQTHRNDASEHADSALDVVAEFCKLIGSKVQSYRRVKEIWENREASGREFKDYLRP